MPTIKDYNHRLHRLTSTAKMTRTMKLVAMSKLYKAQDIQRKTKLYAGHLLELIQRVAAACPQTVPALMERRLPEKNILILVLTSDRGLCGGFNNNVIKFVSHWLETRQADYRRIDINCVGKRGYLALRRRFPVKDYYREGEAAPTFRSAVKIARSIRRDFASGAYDAVYVAFNLYHSPFAQNPHLEKILPVEPAQEIQSRNPFAREYLFEPSPEALFRFLLPRFLYFRIYYALVENAVGEHAARMTAMDSATKNADEMIGRTVILRNRARQAAITNELIEIVAGAEALG